MLQTILALFIIVVFIIRLLFQKKGGNLGAREFYLWMIFWIAAGVAVVFIKKIDIFVAELGFSSSGIDFLFYVSVIVLFYAILRLRLRLEKMEQNITKLVRELALRK